MARIFTCCFVFFILSGFAFGQNAKDYTVALKLNIKPTPLQYIISWPKDVSAVQYQVFSKQPHQLSWTQRGVVANTDTSFTDTVFGGAVEYQVVKINTNYNAYGYIYASQELDEYNYRGKLLLLVDNNYKTPLAAEIKQLETDLKGDGWQVITEYISRTSTPKEVKKIITGLWATDSSSFKSVYLLGRIPVPYSGYVGPDGHPDHYGAWPADLYYSVVDENEWSDYVLNVKVSSDPRNYNIPNDGKFDQDAITPGTAKLQFGRVDFTNMPAFGNDTVLTKKYLDKAHKFKTNQYQIVLRGLIDDNFGGFGGEAFARTGWAGIPVMFGNTPQELDFFTELKTNSYMFSYGCGAGSYNSCSGVGTSGDFLIDSLTSPFTALFGSYFGDWDNQNNFLRAPIASRSLILTSIWSGRPAAYFHQMAMGQTVGYSALASANSPRSLYHSEFINNGIHFGLMGDPSLRLHPITPVSSISLTAGCKSVTVKWSLAMDTAITEYRIYRSETANGKYELVGKTAAIDSFVDIAPVTGKNHYIVRAVRLQKTPSGTYYNIALGVMDSVVFHPAAKPGILLSDSALCSGDTFLIRNGVINYSLPYNQAWTVDGTPVTFADTLKKAFTAAGPHYVSLVTSVTGGCKDSTARHLFVYAIPVADIIVNQQGKCLDSNFTYLTTNAVDVTYHWTFSDGDSSKTQNVIKKFSTFGYHTVKLVAKAINGTCSDEAEEDSILIHPRPAPIVITGEQFPKVNQTYAYKANSAGSNTYKWFITQAPDVRLEKDDSLFVRWNSQLLSATVRVMGRDANGCKTDTASFQLWTVANSVKGVLADQWSVYPVPAQNTLTLANAGDDINAATITLYDAQGKKVMDEELIFAKGEHTLDISALSNGVYFLMIQAGENLLQQKIIKQ